MERKSYAKRSLAILLAILLVLTSVPAFGAVGSEAPEPAAGIEIAPLTTGWATTGVSAYANIAAFLADTTVPAITGGWGTAPTANVTNNSAAGTGTAGPGNLLQIPFDPDDRTATADAHFRRSSTGQGRSATNNGANAFMAFNGLRLQGAFTNSGLGWNTVGAGGQNLDLTTTGGPGSPLATDFTANVGIGADLLQGAAATADWLLVDTVVMHAYISNNTVFASPHPSGASIGRITIESGTAPAFNALHAGNAHAWTWPATADNTAGLATLETTSGAAWRTVGDVAEIQSGNGYTVFVFHLENPVPMRYLRANIEIELPAGHAGGTGTLPSQVGIASIEVYNTQMPPTTPTGWGTSGVLRHADIPAFLADSTVPEVPGGWGTAPTGAGVAGAGSAGPGSIVVMPLDYLDTPGTGSIPLGAFRSSVQGQGRANATNGAMHFMAFNGLRFNPQANIGIGWNTNNAGGAQLNLAVPAAGAPAVDGGGALLADFTANVGIGADLLQGAAITEDWPLVDTVVMHAAFSNGNPFGTVGPAAANGARVARVTIESGTQPAFTALHNLNAHTWGWPATVNNTTGLATLETAPGAEWRTVGATAEIVPGNTDTVFIFHLDEPVPMRYVRANIELFLPEGHRGGFGGMNPPHPEQVNIFPAQIMIGSIEAYNTQATPLAPTQPELVHAVRRHLISAPPAPVSVNYQLNGFTRSELRINDVLLTSPAHFTSNVMNGEDFILFNNAFLASLGPGNHTVQAQFTYNTFTEYITHTLAIHYLTGDGWNTSGLANPTGVLQFPGMADFLAFGDKPNLPLGFWGTAPHMPGIGGAGTTGPENLLVIDFEQGSPWASYDAHFRRAVTGQQANPPNLGSHAFMAFNGIRTMGPYLNSGIGWNTNGAGAQNLDLNAQAGAPGSPTVTGLTVNTGIGADLLQGAPASEPWPLVDTVVMQAQWANTGAPFTAPDPPAARIGQITIESGTAPAFNALSTTNAHVWDWPATANNTAGLATLETTAGVEWRTVGATATTQPGNPYTVFVFHLEEPVPMRYLRANIEMILPPGHAGGAGTFPASIGINFIEVYNTQALASRPWFLPSESTRNHFSGSADPAIAVYRENGHAFDHILVDGQLLVAGTDFTTAVAGGLLTVTFDPTFLATLTPGDYTVEAHFTAYAGSLSHVITVLPAETDTPAFTVEAVPIVQQPAQSAETRNADIVVPQLDGSLEYTPWTTHDSLARGISSETGHELHGNIMPNFSNVGFREGREDIPFLDSSNSFVVRLEPDPSGGDDTARINAAIQQVGSRPVRAHGFRGVVELGNGTFRISGWQGILLDQSGVVLRGSGQGPDGTILLYTHRPGDAVLPNAHIFRNLGVAITMGTAAYEDLGPPDGSYEPGVIAGSGVDRSVTFSNETDVAPGWYPVGTNRITLTSTAGFNVGDRISLLRTPSRSWVNLMNLTSAGNWGFPHDNPALNVGDGALNYQLNFERVITAIEGNDIILHLPLVHGLNIPTDDTAVVRLINESRRVTNVGVENLRIVAARDPENLMNINRGRTAVRTIGVRDGFVRDTTSIFFPFGHTNLYHNSTNISVLNNSYLSPAVELTISARLYGFTIDHGTNSLFDGNYVQGARYEFVTGARVAGPNVFLDGVGEASRIGSENHHRWATGTLFDNIRMLEGNSTFLHAGPGINPPVSGGIGQIRVENRGNNGTGQGWTATSTVFWNPISNDITHSRPPTGQNFVVGRGGIYAGSVVRHQGNAARGDTVIRGGIAGPGSTPTMTALVQDLWDMYGGGAHVENLDFRVNPGSLYRAQVAVRETGEYWNAVPNRPLLQRPMPDTWVSDTGFVISGLHDPDAESVSIYINGVFHDYATIGNAGNNWMFTYTAILEPGYHSIATAQTVNDSLSHLTALRFVNVREDGVHDDTPTGFVFNRLNAGTQNMIERITTLPPLPPPGGGAGGGGGGAPQPTPTPPVEFPFVDVPANAWYREYVEQVWEMELMNGISDTEFAPDDTLSRAMTVTILYRLAGEPAVRFSRAFSDVAPGRWYSDAVAWAVQNDIVQGVGGGRFDPTANVTREQMATMLFRYAEFMDFDTSVAGWATNFVDAHLTSRWALEALQWANANDLIRGQGGNRVNPGGTATRAERAAIIVRFVDGFK